MKQAKIATGDISHKDANIQPYIAKENSNHRNEANFTRTLPTKTLSMKSSPEVGNG
jgi:hypothetical protein